MKITKFIHLIIVCLFLVSNAKAQTYFWNNFPTTTNNTVNWTPAAGNGGGTNQNNMSVNVVSSNGSRYYSYGTTSQYGGTLCGNATNGLLLEMASGNWTNKITVTITFATPVCGPISFNIQDINEDRWSGDNSSYFMDRISVGALNGVSTAIAPANITVGGCSPTSTTSGNNRVVTANFNNCQCNTTSISINDAGAKIKQITLVYDNGTPAAKYNAAVCQWQYVIVGSLTGATLPPTANITAPAPPCGTASTTLTGTTSASSPTYSWTGPGTITSPTASATAVNGAGVYTLTINPASSCSTTTQYTVTAAGGAPSITITPTNSVICSGQTSNLAASGATTYTWSVNAGSATTSTVNVSPSSTTIYTVTGSTAGCSSTQTVSIAANTTPTLSISGATNLCAGQSTVLTGTAAATYTWSANAGSVTTNSASVTPGVGTTTYTLTGANGTCTASAVQTVTVTATPTISVNSATVCAGFGASLIASGATSYTWSPATGLSSTTSATVTATPTATTVYTITGTTSGCSSTNTSTVTVNTSPTLTLTSTSSSICKSATNATLTAAGANTYTWSPAGSLSSSTGSSVTATPTTTTTYTATGTATNGCTNTNTVAITVNPLPTLTLTPSSTTVCPAYSATISASGASTYTWSPASTLNTSTGSSVIATPTTATIYTVTGTSALGCTNTNTVSVSVNPSLTLTVNSATACKGTGSSLVANGATTYSWSPASGLSATTGATVTATPTTTTIYTVTGNVGVCSSTQTSTVTINPIPVLTITPTSVTVCTGSSATITAAGASTYTWSPASTLSSSTGSVVVSTPTVNTTYTVNATDNNGCTNNATVSVGIATTPTLNISPASSLTLCLGDSTVLSVSGATTYTWSSSDAGSLSSTTGASVTATPTTTTTYTVNGTLGSCGGASTTATITVNFPPDVTPHATSHTICVGSTTTLSATGSAISFTWSPSGSLNTSFGTPVVASPTVTTNYTVTGTAANGCTATDSIKITVNPTPTISISSSGGGSSQTVCSASTVNGITFNTAAGVGAIWYNNNINIGLTASDTGNIPSYTAPTLTVTETGVITAIAIDSTTGCRSSVTNPPSFTVTINPLPIISATDSLTPGGCGGLANGCISNVAGQAPGTYQYSWDNGATWSNNSQNCNIPAGNYVVEVKDANGCISQKPISLPSANAPALPTVAGLPTNTCAGDTIDLSITSVVQPHMTFTWTTSAGTQTGTTYTITNANPAGTYTVGLNVADSNACSNSTSFSFTVNALPQPVISGANHFCKGTSTVLNVTPNGTNFTYQWNNAGVLIAGATASSYTATSGGIFGVAVTNTLTGCSHDTTITITVDSVPAAPSVTTSTNNNTYCQGTSISPITVTGNGTFNWYSDAGLITQIGTGSPFTPTITTTGTVTIYVTASSSVCTGDSTPVNIIINPTPATPTITIGAGSQAYCANVNPLPAIVANGPSTIVWYDDLGLTHTINTGTTYTPTGLSPNTTTTYYLVDSSAAGCKSVGTATASVTIYPNPAAPIVTSPATNQYCENQTIGAITASGASTIVWYDDAGMTHTIATGSTYTPTGLSPNTTTTYYLADSSAQGCKSVTNATVSVTINALPSTPTVTTGNTNSYCDGSTISPINVTGNGTIIWYSNAALTPPAVNTGNSYTPSGLSPNTTTTYYLTDTSAAGCKSSNTATVSITINPKPVITGNATVDSSLCGKNNGAVLGLTASNGTPNYTYQWVDASGATVGSSPDLTNVGAGTYSLIVIDANNCRDTSNGSGYTVGASNAVTADFTPSTYQGTAPLAVTFSNTSTNATSYGWSFGTNTSTSTQANPSYTYTNTGTYVVTLVAAHGNCTDTARKTITVDAQQVIIIPNIFSPNGDGINDQFFITSSGLASLTCDIYNRWGQLVFSIKSLNQTWDGVMNNGNHASEGTYFFILQATGLDGKDYKQQGPLTLVK